MQEDRRLAVGSGRASLVCTGCMGILDHALGMDGHRSADPWKKSVGIWIRGGGKR